tara:strand:- start:92 stop:538 length:447 start_codon:yes stop_codon:yes gene_type:complete
MSQQLNCSVEMRNYWLVLADWADSDQDKNIWQQKYIYLYALYLAISYKEIPIKPEYKMNKDGIIIRGVEDNISEIRNLMKYVYKDYPEIINSENISQYMNDLATQGLKRMKTVYEKKFGTEKSSENLRQCFIKNYFFEDYENAKSSTS